MMRDLTAPGTPAPLTAPTTGSPVTAPTQPGALTLPDALVPRVPRERIAWAVGSGQASATVRVITAVTAHATMSGQAVAAWSGISTAVTAQAGGTTDTDVDIALTGATVTATTSTTGTALATATGGYGRGAQATTTGTATAAAYPALAVRAQQVGIGTATLDAYEVEYGMGQAKATTGASALARVVAPADATGSMIGAASATAYPVYRVTATAGTTVTGTADVEKVMWQNSGITKVGTQNIGRNVWETITGWTVRSGYPGTVITGAGIEVPAGTYTISAQITATNSTSDGLACRICLDGTPIPSLTGDPGQFTFPPSASRTVTDTVALNEGTITIQGIVDKVLAGDRIIQPTDTWLTIEKA